MKLFKMKLLLATFLVLFAVAVCMASVKASTDTDVTWVNAGNVNIVVVSDNDQITSLTIFSGASDSSGEFHASDRNDNPYGYGVDTVWAWTKSKINSGGGSISFTTFRTDSKVSMYGNPGQVSYTFIGTADFAELNFKTWTNYAEMSNAQYGAYPGWTMNFKASGSMYYIEHGIVDSDGDGARVTALGSGIAEIKLQGEKSGGKNGYFNLGCLPVCGDSEAWDNNYAKFVGSGAGSFGLAAWADNGLFVHEGGLTIPGDGSPNSATYNLNIGYAGTFTFPDFGIKGS